MPVETKQIAVTARPATYRSGAERPAGGGAPARAGVGPREQLKNDDSMLHPNPCSINADVRGPAIVAFFSTSRSSSVGDRPSFLFTRVDAGHERQSECRGPAQAAAAGDHRELGSQGPSHAEADSRSGRTRSAGAQGLGTAVRGDAAAL